MKNKIANFIYFRFLNVILKEIHIRFWNWVKFFVFHCLIWYILIFFFLFCSILWFAHRLDTKCSHVSTGHGYMYVGLAHLSICINYRNETFLAKKKHLSQQMGISAWKQHCEQRIHKDTFRHSYNTQKIVYVYTLHTTPMVVPFKWYISAIIP